MAHITVDPEQIKFSDTKQQACTEAEPTVDFHTIVQDTHPVGFFKIDDVCQERGGFVDTGDIWQKASQALST